MTGRVIALGFFDGVHLGHGALLQAARRVALEKQLRPAALSFTGAVAGKPLRLLNTLSDRQELMRRHWGVEEMLLLQFDDTLMHMSPEDFLQKVIREFDAVHLVAGYDFTYGYKGAGKAETLRQQCQALGIGCTIVPPVEVDGVPISSTTIRNLIGDGRMEEAVTLLGHPHVLTGPVHHGYQLGRTMGWPTVNQLFPPEIAIPAHGVYAARVTLPDGTVHFGAANVGTRPTVSTGTAVTLETHILGYHGDLYDACIRTKLFARLRPEQHFDSKEALGAQILRDGEHTKAWFAEHSHLLQPVNPALQQYLEETILPRYQDFDGGHDLGHVRAVMENAMELALGYDVCPNMVAVMAAYHDLGLPQGRETHHLTSAALLRQDENLRQWFSDVQIETMAQAVEDHRASAKTPPRSIYGKILSDGDRCLEPETVVRRTLEYGAVHYPGLSREEQFSRLKAHMEEKYSERGYLKLCLDTPSNTKRLAALRAVISDDAKLKAIFDAWYEN